MQAANQVVEDDAPAGEDRRTGWLNNVGVVLITLVVCGVAISAQSYWIDELAVAYKAAMPSLVNWWHFIVLGGSDLQQPLYPFLAWILNRLIPLNEFALRSMNFAWFVMGLLAISQALNDQPRLRWSVLLVLFCSPFAWYYLNEARPYTLQLGASLVVFSAIYRLGCGTENSRSERAWMWMLCIGSVMLAASGMLAMLWLGAYLGAGLLSTPASRLRSLLRQNWLACLLIFSCLFCIGCCYLWAVMIGARATDAGTTDVKNVLFVFFELFGCNGLGPGRLTIRTEGFRAFAPWLPVLAIYGAVLFLVFIAGCGQVIGTTPFRTRLWWSGCFVLVCAFIFAVGTAVRFRVLGRHFTPLVPLIVFLLGAGLVKRLENPGFRYRLVLGAYFLFCMASCLELRFAQRHAKDDYREAARLGTQAIARGQVVWWNAYDIGAAVYHLPLVSQPGATHAALFLINPQAGFEKTLQKPDLVLASKPDLYDGSGELNKYLQREGFVRTQILTAFSVWEPKGDSQSPTPSH